MFLVFLLSWVGFFFFFVLPLDIGVLRGILINIPIVLLAQIVQ